MYQEFVETGLILGKGLLGVLLVGVLAIAAAAPFRRHRRCSLWYNDDGKKVCVTSHKCGGWRCAK